MARYVTAWYLGRVEEEHAVNQLMMKSGAQAAADACCLASSLAHADS